MKKIKEYNIDNESFYIYGGYCDGCTPIIRNELINFSDNEEYIISLNDECFRNFYINEVYLIKNDLVKLIKIDKFEKCGIGLFKISDFSGKIIVKCHMEHYSPTYILTFESDKKVDIKSVSENEWKAIGGKFNNYKF